MSGMSLYFQCVLLYHAHIHFAKPITSFRRPAAAFRHARACDAPYAASLAVLESMVFERGMFSGARLQNQDSSGRTFGDMVWDEVEAKFDRLNSPA